MTVNLDQWEALFIYNIACKEICAESERLEALKKEIEGADPDSLVYFIDQDEIGHTESYIASVIELRNKVMGGIL